MGPFNFDFDKFLELLEEMLEELRVIRALLEEQRADVYITPDVNNAQTWTGWDHD